MEINYDVIPVQSKFDDKWNYIKNDRILSQEWFLKAWPFDDDGLAIVQRIDGTWCKIDENGNFVKKGL